MTREHDSFPWIVIAKPLSTHASLILFLCFQDSLTPFLDCCILSFYILLPTQPLLRPNTGPAAHSVSQWMVGLFMFSCKPESQLCSFSVISYINLSRSCLFLPHKYSLLFISTVIQIKLLSYLNYHTGLLIKPLYTLSFSTQFPHCHWSVLLFPKDKLNHVTSHVSTCPNTWMASFAFGYIQIFSIAYNILHGLVPTWYSHFRLHFTPPFSRASSLTELLFIQWPRSLVKGYLHSVGITLPLTHSPVISYLLERHSWSVKRAKGF